MTSALPRTYRGTLREKRVRSSVARIGNETPGTWPARGIMKASVHNNGVLLEIVVNPTVTLSTWITDAVAREFAQSILKAAEEARRGLVGHTV